MKVLLFTIFSFAISFHAFAFDLSVNSKKAICDSVADLRDYDETNSEFCANNGEFVISDYDKKPDGTWHVLFLFKGKVHEDQGGVEECEGTLLSKGRKHFVKYMSCK